MKSPEEIGIERLTPKEKAIRYLNKREWWGSSDISENNKEIRVFNHALDIALKAEREETDKKIEYLLELCDRQSKDWICLDNIKGMVKEAFKGKRE